MRKFFNRKNKKESIEQTKEKRIEQKEDSLTLSQNCDKVSVFFNGREIINHSEKRPFLEVDIGEHAQKNKGKEIKIKKILPLINVDAEKREGRVILNFHNKGYCAVAEIIDNNGAVKIKIKKRDDKLLTINFPRGTKEKDTHYIGRKELKNGENQYKTTRISNFYSSEKSLYSLKTAKEWEIEIDEKSKKMKVKGEKAKIYIVFGETKEQTIAEHRKRDEVKDLEKGKREIYISTKKEKYKEKIERIEKLAIPLNGIVTGGLENKLELDEMIAYLKAKKMNAIIKVMPYVPKRKKVEIEEFLVKNKEGGFYEEEINGEKFYAINLADKEARRYLQNKVRALLDQGVKGLIAEKGYINKNQADLPKEKKFCYSEVWYILWQKLVKEVVDEYPAKKLLLRNCGAKSPHYGIIMTDEAKWKDIEKNRMKLRIEKMTDCGMGEIITEIGGIDNEKEKDYRNFDAWLDIAKEMSIIIFGSIPEKELKKNVAKIKQKLDL